MEEAQRPIGAVLAGGAATRLGGAKATRELAGRPLIAHPLAAFAEVGLEAFVVAKARSPLPEDLDAPVVTEPAEPRHPLAGIVAALSHAGERPVVVCACDMPLVTATEIGLLAAATGTTIARGDGRIQPLLGRYEPEDIGPLRAALGDGRPVTGAALALRPRSLEVPATVVFNVNTQADLDRAEQLLSRARR